MFKSASDFSVKSHSRCNAASLMKHFKTMKYQPNYVRNLRRRCVKKAWKISQDWTGFQPMTSTITVQCSYHWVIKPTGSWSLDEFAKISKVELVGIHNSSHRLNMWHFIYSLKKCFVGVNGDYAFLWSPENICNSQNLITILMWGSWSESLVIEKNFLVSSVVLPCWLLNGKKSSYPWHRL